MPAIIIGRPKRTEGMRLALKNHIIRERQRKKQEQEADAEVERQRKERERQQKQNVMTLGETRDQIQQLESSLKALKDEKHQLFLQLKKVLNEDDNRRRQLVKDSSEMINIHAYTGVLGGHPPIFIQQNIGIAGRAPIYKVTPTDTTQRSFLTPTTMKRLRSPSPPAPNYHHGYGGYKPNAMPTYSQPSKYLYESELDDGRRGQEYMRAVLWNKNSQYPPSNQQFYQQPVSAQSTISYAPAQQPIYTYAAPQYGGSSQREDHNQAKPPHGVYLGQPMNPATGYATPIHQGIPESHGGPPKAGFSSAAEAEKYYNVSQIRPATHVPIHGGAIPIQQPPQGAKTGSITSGYPIRGQPVGNSPHAPNSASYQPSVTSHNQNVYVNQASSTRHLYNQAPPQGRYPNI